MKCADCREQAAPNRTRCAKHLSRYAAKARASYVPAAERASAKIGDDYPNRCRPYSTGEWQAAYDATPPERWALMFWQAMSIRLGRPMGGVYRRAVRIGAKPKVVK